ncbi:MAG: uracil-DNA glycosylase [Caulobacterales bacterium]|nr:uracil-DNA glycosylase [Caulobacterales bacterium]MCA0372956.1 uracil-DNA glycosylase [Pseudomonadota bacterium]
MTFAKEAPKNCNLCPRLVEYRNKNAAENPDWFNGPAPSFGDENANILVAGLAPGRMGANRTGRPFTGDYAGELLYQTLKKFGLMFGEYKADPLDGIELKNVIISNVVRCAPPENKPTPQEISICSGFLKARLAALPKLHTIICLGKISHDSIIRTLGAKPSQYKFAHAAEHIIGNYRIVDSYHCSRYNTQTNRLTTPMFENVFSIALKN